MAVPASGEKAPDFTLPRDGGGTVSLADFKGRKLVLYFYPKADTPGCTKEAIAFNALQARLRQGRYRHRRGLGRSGARRRTSSATSMSLTIALASDEDEENADRLWGLGREVDVRPQVHGSAAHHAPDRPRRARRAGLGERQGPGPCRGGARRRPRRCEESQARQASMSLLTANSPLQPRHYAFPAVNAKLRNSTLRGKLTM